MANITKWTAKEIAEDKSLIRRVECFDIRQCSFCGAYVRVEDQAGEHEFRNRTTAEDICDDCVDCIEDGKDIKLFEDCSYEDYLEDDDDEDNYDNEEDD